MSDLVLTEVDKLTVEGEQSLAVGKDGNFLEINDGSQVVCRITPDKRQLIITDVDTFNRYADESENAPVGSPVDLAQAMCLALRLALRSSSQNPTNPMKKEK